MRAALFNSPFSDAAAVLRVITFYAYRRAKRKNNGAACGRAGMGLTKPGGGFGAPHRASPSAPRAGRGGRRREGRAAPGHGALGGGTRPEPAVSVPREKLTCAAATATAEPELEPPEMKAGSIALRQAP